VLLRMSHLFLRTLREDPAEAEVTSHKLLVRAGYIRRAAPGIYTWLPLGLMVKAKIEQIVREEMAAAGAQEVFFPALLPREPFEVTGRWSEYGDNLFRLQDRKKSDYLLAPTHEEMFTLLVKDLYSSYKDLPLTIYQIQNKYRDEARPRAGLLRGREFVMKDAYSFDVNQEGLEKSYQAQRDAYERIFTRLGIDYVIVKADAGAMGGSASEEFLAPSAIGEDTFVRSQGGYAANVEAVKTLPPAPISFEGKKEASIQLTPNAGTIDSIVKFADNQLELKIGKEETLKNIVFQLGKKYAEALDLKVLDENGKLVTVTMGSYGIGVTRIVAVIAEANNDDKGLIWPDSVAPVDVLVVAAGKEAELYQAADELAEKLELQGKSVLIDDRQKVSPGVKFSDAELLGVPKIVIVGRGLANGEVDIWDRRSGERSSVKVELAVSELA